MKDLDNFLPHFAIGMRQKVILSIKSLRLNAFWFLYGYRFVTDNSVGKIVNKESTIIQWNFFWSPFVNLSIILVPILGENESVWLPDDRLKLTSLKGEGDPSSCLIGSHIKFTNILLYLSATVCFSLIPQTISGIRRL